MTILDAELHHLEINQLATLLASREITSRAVTEAQLERIASVDGALHSYALVMADSARADADAADQDLAKGVYRGPLHGVPVAVKDLCWTKGVPTSAGMAIHRAFLPPDNATVVQRLREAGAVILGKLQLTEGAYSDHHPSIIPPQNPWNAAFWPGISSSGSATATAAGLCYGSLGSDTGGSIRWPSAANGVTGLKPTWGRVSRYGVFDLAPTLDHVGAIARSAIDTGLLLGVIAGRDPKDPTSLADPVPDYLAEAELGARGLRVGIAAAWNETDVDDQTRRTLGDAARVFADLGSQMVEIRFPEVEQIVADWSPNCAVEAAVAHEKTYPARADDYGPVLASVIEAGRALSGVDYQKILMRRMAFRGRVQALFDHIDVLLTPVQPVPPLSLETIRTLGEQPELVAKLQRYTCPFDASGHPTITLPGGFSDEGMPMGFQLVAAHVCEAVLVRAGAAYQSATEWHRRHPAV